MIRKILWTLAPSLTILGILLSVLGHASVSKAIPNAGHCGDVGPLPLDDPDFCGCTWGEVIYRGQMIPDAEVTLEFNGQTLTSLTAPTVEPFPHYDLTAYHLGAKRGDVFTLTAQYAGQTISRKIRAWPQGDSEQHVTLVFPDKGLWEPWLTLGYTNTLLLDGTVLWAGGPAGVVEINTTTNISITHPLPWANQQVRKLAHHPNGHIWAIGAGGVLEYDSLTWQPHTPPTTMTIRDLTIDPQSGTLWLGGGDTGQGEVAAYNGSWQPIADFPEVVTALTVDSVGRTWVGTWGNGVYRQDGNGGWDNLRDADGLASNYIYVTAAANDDVWFGTSPYLSGQEARGGVAQYSISSDTWTAHRLENGLPADDNLENAPAAVHALALDEDGVPWIGTSVGIHVLTSPTWWSSYTATHGIDTEKVYAMASDNVGTFATTHTTISRLNANATLGTPPTASIDPITPTTIRVGETLTLAGSGIDTDESSLQIVGWSWMAGDTILCDHSTCQLPYRYLPLPPGIYTVSFRVIDDEGQWSAPVVQSIQIEEVSLFLPTILKK